MLLKYNKNQVLMRMHGAFVDEEKREETVRYLKTSM
jgi:hypothetical protein